MKKIDRRSFLSKIGWLTAGLASAPYFRLGATENSDTPLESAKLTSAEVKPSGDYFEARLSDHSRALINPGMGWTMHFNCCNIDENYGAQLAPYDTLDDFPGVNGPYLRIPWAYVEPEEGKFRWELLDTQAQKWIQRGQQVSFRFTSTETWLYKATPQWVFEAGAKGYDVADGWVYEPEYDDPIFLEKVENFVRVLSARYDGNPSVAFMDIGHFGMWGEGHTVPTTPKHGLEWGFETQKKYIDLYCRHFKRTQLVISDDYAGPFLRGDHFPIMDYALSKGVTMRDDSILVSKAPEHWYHDQMAQKFWPTLPVILEHEHYGLSKKRGNWDSNLWVESVEAYHASYMSIHWWPRVELEECREAIDRINRRLGYRLRMDSIRWPKQTNVSEDFTIESTWTNAGVAPCYQGGYPCFTLKDAQGGIVSVLVDTALDVKDLNVDKPEQSAPKTITSRFAVAPRGAEDKSRIVRRCAPGTFDLYVSVGRCDGTPLYALPYDGDDGHKRYLIGQITLEEDK